MNAFKGSAVLLVLLLAGQANAAGSFPSSTVQGQGPADPEALFCDLQAIASDLAPDSVRYRADGQCKFVRGKRGVNYAPANASTFDDYNKATELYRFSWTAWGTYSPVTKITVEEITAPPPRVDQATPANRPYGRYRLEMICERDPWLDSTASTRCTQPRVFPAGNLPPEVQAALKFTGKPFTAQMKTEQLLALRAAQQQFDQRQATLAKVGNQPLSSATSTTRAGATVSAGSQPLSAATSTTRAGATTSMTAGALGALGAASTRTTTTVQGVTAAGPTPTPPAGTTGTSTGTGTVSAALKLQAALEAQRAQQGAQGGAASAPAPAPSAKPASDLYPRVLEPQPNSVVQRALTVRAEPSVAHGVPQTAIVEVTFMTPLATTPPAAVGLVPSPHKERVSSADLARGVRFPMSNYPESAGRWRLVIYYEGSGVIKTSLPLLFDWVPPAPLQEQAAAGAAAGAAGQVQRQALSPQPLPPKETVRASSQLDQRALNPQPLPPGQARKDALEAQSLPSKAAAKGNPLERQALNPQPLPPKEGAAPTSAFQR
jgi:hypothetical protein